MVSRALFCIAGTLSLAACGDVPTTPLPPAAMSLSAAPIQFAADADLSVLGAAIADANSRLAATLEGDLAVSVRDQLVRLSDALEHNDALAARASAVGALAALESSDHPDADAIRLVIAMVRNAMPSSAAFVLE